MLVAMSLGCGSCKGSNGTQKNKHKEGDISGAWRFVCCCAAFQEKRILSFGAYFQDCISFIFS